MVEAITIAPPDNLDEETQALWMSAYADALEQTDDVRKAELAAWGAVRKAERYRLTVKSYTDDGAIVGGWGMLFTDAQALDLDRQYFDGQTQTAIEYYQNAPLFYEHGQDRVYGADIIGKRIGVQVYPRGIWVEHQLHKNHPHYERTLQEVEDGELSLSSDTMGHYMMEGYDPQDGRLGIWPIAAWSLTKSPAEPGLGIVTIQEFEQAVKSAAVRAREASSSTDNSTSPQSYFKQETVQMTVETVVNMVAQALGLSETATDEDVINAIKSSWIAPLHILAGKADELDEEDAEKMDGVTEEDAEKMVDAATLREMFGVETDEDLIAALEEFVGSLVPMPMESEEGVVDYGKMAAAVKASRELETPALPMKTRKQERKMENRTRNIAPAHAGKAKSPTVSNMIRALCGVEGYSMKSMSAQIGALGGYVTDHGFSTEVIEYLYANQVMLASGASTVNVSGYESFQLPVQDSAFTAYLVGENQEITASDIGFSTITISPRELAARVLIPRRLINNASFNLEAYVRGEMAKALNVKMDDLCINGTGGVVSGSAMQPLGLRNLPGVTTNLATNGRQPKLDDLVDAVGRVEDANVDITNGAWLFSPRTRRTFTKLTDTTGEPLLRPSWSQGEDDAILGYGYHTTTNISNTETVGTNSDNSFIVFGNMPDAVVAMGNDIEIQVDDRQFFSYNQVQVRAIMSFDFVVKRTESFEVITGVRT